MGRDSHSIMKATRQMAHGILFMRKDDSDELLILSPNLLRFGLKTLKYKTSQTHNASPMLLFGNLNRKLCSSCR